MTENEDILDSGQITPSLNEHMEYLPELDLSENRFASIEWKPIVKGGASFSTHSVVLENTKILKFVANKKTWLFGSIFFIPVFVLFYFCMVSVIYHTAAWNLILLFFFFIFFALVTSILEMMTAPSIFDKSLGLFWKQRPTIPRLLNPKGNFVVNLKDIQAIQILSQRIKNKNRTYNSYEINLILENNQRLNVVDQGNAKVVLNDAKELADFLDVPLLNGVERN